MSNYMILPELDSNSVKIGLTKCGVSTAPHSLYKRYHSLTLKLYYYNILS